jgi:hypothetical protein
MSSEIADLDRLSSALVSAIGPSNALTIDKLTERLGLSSRRETEMLIQDGLASLPFVVVASGLGYYRPSAADQVNAYIHSLRRRHEPLVRRERIVRHKALAAGYVLEGDTFVDPQRAVSMELFDAIIPCTTG